MESTTEHRFAVAEGETQSLYSAKEIARGYAIDMKRVILAYVVEIVIVVTSLIGAWQFAVMYGNNDFNTMLMMLLAPVAYGIVEFCRVPLALAVQKPSYTLFIRLIIVLGLIGAAFVTVKSVSQLGEIMFRPRLFDVVHARETLAEAQSAAALIKTQIADADALVAQRQTEAQNADQEVTTASENLAKIKGQECAPISGIGKNGHRYQGMKCSTDPRVGSLKEAVNTATAHRTEAAARLTEANAQRNTIDRAETDTVLRGEKTKYREAVMHSQLHSFSAIVFGKEPTEVTDAEIHMFLRLFVFLPAIGAAFSATIIALTAISRIPPSQVELADDANAYVLGPLAESILQKATEEHIRALSQSVQKAPESPHLKAI